MRRRQHTDDCVHAVCEYPLSNPPLVTLVDQAGNGVAVMVTLAVSVGLGVSDGVAVSEGVSVAVRVRVIVLVAVRVRVRVLDAVWRGLRVMVRVAVRVRVMVRDFVTLTVRVAVTVGVIAPAMAARRAAAATSMRLIDKASPARLSIIVVPLVCNHVKTVATDAVGTMLLSTAHAPATCGAAMLVPW
jgi:hypothetical protein